MKASRIFKLMGLLLAGLVLTAQAEAIDRTNRPGAKKAIALTIDKPILDFVSRTFDDQVNVNDLVRMQKILGQVNYVTVSFRDPDASDYILKFKSLDEQGLESWMFDEGYLDSAPETKVVSPANPVAAAETAVAKIRHHVKNAINLTVDKPVIDFVAHAYADQIDANDIVRLQKMVGQIDHIRVTFLDQDAADYILTFKSLDERGLESWMFNEGYLTASPKAEADTVIPWMLAMHLN